MEVEKIYKELKEKKDYHISELQSIKNNIANLELQMTMDQYKIDIGTLVIYKGETYKISTIEPTSKRNVGFSKPHIKVNWKKKDGGWSKSVKYLWGISGEEWKVV